MSCMLQSSSPGELWRDRDESDADFYRWGGIAVLLGLDIILSSFRCTFSKLMVLPFDHDKSVSMHACFQPGQIRTVQLC